MFDDWLSKGHLLVPDISRKDLDFFLKDNNAEFLCNNLSNIIYKYISVDASNAQPLLQHIQTKFYYIPGSF